MTVGLLQMLSKVLSGVQPGVRVRMLMAMMILPSHSRRLPREKCSRRNPSSSLHRFPPSWDLPLLEKVPKEEAALTPLPEEGGL